MVGCKPVCLSQPLMYSIRLSQYTQYVYYIFFIVTNFTLNPQQLNTYSHRVANSSHLLAISFVLHLPTCSFVCAPGPAMTLYFLSIY